MPTPTFVLLPTGYFRADPPRTHVVLDKRGGEVGHYTSKIDADRAARFLNVSGARLHKYGPYEVAPLAPSAADDRRRSA